MKKQQLIIKKSILEHENLLKIFSDEKFQKQLIKAITVVVKAVKNKKKILVCGNGGSAADSQHFTGELVGRFRKERKPIPCVALTTNTSILTSIGNDYSFEKIFSRQVEAIGNKNDILILISTSGKSKNVIQAAITAKKMGIKTISLTGERPNELAELSDINLAVPSNSTPRIQEIHSILIHIICELLEEILFPDGNRKT